MEFTGYRLSGRSYRKVKPDRENRIYSDIAGLYLAVRNERLRWMTEDGHILPSHEELSQLLEKNLITEKQRSEMEKQRAEKEKQRAEKEKQRAEKAEEELILEKQRSEYLANKLKELGIYYE